MQASCKHGGNLKPKQGNRARSRLLMMRAAAKERAYF